MTKENIEQSSGEGGEEVERYEEMVTEINNRILKLPLKEKDQYLTSLQKFEEEHSKVSQYLLWHRLIGSTVDEPMPFDAPNPLVRKLIEDLYKKYVESNESA